VKLDLDGGYPYRKRMSRTGLTHERLNRSIFLDKSKFRFSCDSAEGVPIPK